MNYSETVDGAFARSSAAQGVDLAGRSTLKALGEKQKAEGSLSHLEGLSLSGPDRLLLENRVIGGTVTRLALASSALKATGEISESFYELSAENQDEIRSEIYDNLGRTWQQAIEEAGSSAVLSDFDTVSQLDTVQSVPHSFVRQQVTQTKRDALTRGDHFRRFVSYVNVIPGTFPPANIRYPSIGANNGLFVQAFGRNSIPDKQLPDVVNLKRDLGDDELVFQALDAQGFDSGDSNKALAEVVRYKLLSGTVIEPMIQWEVTHALRETSPDVYKAYANYLHSLWPKSDFYPTHEVKKDSVEVADVIGLYTLEELAHADMMIRALGILTKLGVEADILVAEIPFDERSVQSQVRGPLRWMIRETLARLEHLLRQRVEF
ncbi:MAG: hypothetical protein WAQ27_03935 [Candidatus Microsaccharimonas sp.]